MLTDLLRADCHCPKCNLLAEYKRLCAAPAAARTVSPAESSGHQSSVDELLKAARANVSSALSWICPCPRETRWKSQRGVGSSVGQSHGADGSNPSPTAKPHYFDRKPPDAITAVQVRRFADIVGANSPALHLDTLQRLLTHQGVSSTARAVIEAALNG